MRHVPIITGLFWIGVSLVVLFLWRAVDGFMYWVRGVVFGLPMLFGLHSLKVGLFGSDQQVKRIIDSGGNNPKNKDTEF
jgi:hypothetical protein